MARDFGRAARIANTVLGVWLLVSVFLWWHSPAQRVNVALSGIFITLTGVELFDVAYACR